MPTTVLLDWRASPVSPQRAKMEEGLGCQTLHQFSCAGLLSCCLGVCPSMPAARNVWSSLECRAVGGSEVPLPADTVHEPWLIVIPVAAPALSSSAPSSIGAAMSKPTPTIIAHRSTSCLPAATCDAVNRWWCGQSGRAGKPPARSTCFSWARPPCPAEPQSDQATPVLQRPAARSLPCRQPLQHRGAR